MIQTIIQQYLVNREGNMENGVEIFNSFEIKLNLREDLEVKYTLVRHESDKAYGIDGECYGINITADIKGIMESLMLEDISRDYEQALDVMFLLARNTVLPDTALYVMEDLLS